jgi:phage gp45-like
MQNLMRLEAQREASTRALTKRATVSAYDPSTYAVKVIIQPEGHETGYIPVGSPWVGAGWGMFSPPSPGDEVDVHFQEGGKNAAYVSLRFWGNVAPPVAVASGEFWLLHSSGTFLKLTNDGKISINGHLEIDATAPTINITATSRVNVTAPDIRLSNGGTLRKMVTDAFQPLFDSHTHDSSGPPNQQMNSSHLTGIVKAE